MRAVALLIAQVALAVPLAAQTNGNTPPCSTPEYRQMDFWVGNWDVEFTNPDSTIGKATNRITKDAYGACVIREHFVQPGGGQNGADFVGGSYSIYDQQTKTWRQMWVDNHGGMFDLRGGPVSGQPYTFELVNVEPRGAKQATMRMIWQDVTADRFTWRWQRRTPEGNWVDQWVLRYKRSTRNE